VRCREVRDRGYINGVLAETHWTGSRKIRTEMSFTLGGHKELDENGNVISTEGHEAV